MVPDGTNSANTFSKEHLMDEQFIPVGPLLPLGIRLRDNPTKK
jgi:hypothetical protein